MYTLNFNPGSLDTYTVGFELTVEELGGYQCNTQFLSIDSYDNNNIVNITLGDDISFSSNIISGSIKIAFISQYEDSFIESITMRYNDSNNNINKTISQQIKMNNPLVDLSWYARDNIENYQTITEIPQEHLNYLQSGLHASNMEGMFGGCEKLTTIPKLNIDTSQCVNMASMFDECKSLTSIDVSNWDTSNVTNMSDMFYGCELLSSIDLTNFNVDKVLSTAGMFGGCSILEYFDISKWDTSKIMRMQLMFRDCINISTINGILDMKSCQEMWEFAQIFENCPKLTGLKIKNFPSGYDSPTFESVAGLSSSQYTIVS